MNKIINDTIGKKSGLVLILFLIFGFFFKAYSQTAYSIGTILDSIEKFNPISKIYEADIRSMDEAARGAKSWMPPELGAGFFMTPYNTQRWKKMSEMEPGMGSIMVSAQQMIPNRRKLNADATYMQSMSAAAKEQKKFALNDLYAQAKKSILCMGGDRKEKKRPQ